MIPIRLHQRPAFKMIPIRFTNVLR